MADRWVRHVVLGVAGVMLLAPSTTAFASADRAISADVAGAREARAETLTATTPGFSDRASARLLGARADDVSFSVHDRLTETTYTFNADLRNDTGSVVKVLVLATLIRERRESGRGLTRGQQALAEQMIRHSDNDATTRLLSQAGGSAAMRRMADDLGMTRTRVSGAWGRTSTSAADQRLLVDRLVDGTPHLSAADRQYILGLMSSVTPEQAWGVGRPVANPAEGMTVQVKNGWVEIPPRGWRVNSIGRIRGAGRDYTLSILTYDNASMNVGVELTQTVSAHVWRTLGSSGNGSHVLAGAQTASGAIATWIRRGEAFPPRPW